MPSLPKGVKRQTKRLADNTVASYFYWRATNERLPDPEREPQKFARAVARCEKGIGKPATPQRSRGAVAGTLGALILERQKNRKYLMDTKVSTRAQYDYDLRRFSKQYPETLSAPIDGIDRRSIRLVRDAYAETSTSYANRIVRTLSALFAFAIKQDLLTVNPCDGIDAYPGGSHTRWTDEQISFALANLPPHAARGVFLEAFTAQRGGDCSAMCWSQYDGRLLRLTQEKTDTELALPVYIFPQLQSELDRWRREDKVRPIDASQDRILRTMHGTAWASSKSYERSMRHLMRKHPELDGLVLHGLRHAFCARAVERGATPDQIKAWTGHRSDAMLQLYMQGARQVRIAEGLGQVAERGGNWILGTGWEPGLKALKSNKKALTLYKNKKQ